jgi:hypothetical protein
LRGLYVKIGFPPGINTWFELYVFNLATPLEMKIKHYT